MLQSSIDKNEIPGAVALIARNGKIVYHKAFGIADPETGRAYQTDDIFRIASQTKAITATAVMMLWEEGLFHLDDPIAKFIPEFENMMILDSLIESDSSFMSHPANKNITIRHLLTHTSGIGYGFIDDHRFSKIYQKAGIIDGFSTDSVTIQENIRKLARMPLHHEPGAQWTYSEGLDVLGYLIEVLSGQPLDQFFQERIFEPIGMVDTHFFLRKEKANRLVPVLHRFEQEWKEYSFNPYYDPAYPISGARAFFSGGAGLSSTALDYAKFLQMYLNNGTIYGRRILSRKTIELIMSDQIGNLYEEFGFSHGLAFSILNEKGEAQGGLGSEGTFDWGGYFNSKYFVDPKEKVIAVFLKQMEEVQSDDTNWQFRQLVFSAIDN
ncbi:MAG: beta-lactamase family protein [Ekhidna sp.]|nr:beta-lactamase family protein [Ekhidna sp.]